MSLLANEISKCKHPNSRKTIALSKRIKKFAKREKSKLGHEIKLNVLGEKIMWFKENLDDSNVYSGSQFKELIEKYLSRFDNELSEINAKQAIGGGHRKKVQGGRQTAIKMTVEKEKEEFNTCGIELIDLRKPGHLKDLRQWDGELRFLQNFTIQRIARKHLNDNKNVETNVKMELESNT